MEFARFDLIFVPYSHYDETKTLLYQTTSICLVNADGVQYLVGNRQFTQMLPTRNDNPIIVENWHALQKLKSFEKPFLNLFSDKDIIAPKGYHSVRPAITGTRDYEPVILKGGSHFLLEDLPEEYAREVIAFLGQVHGD